MSKTAERGELAADLSNWNPEEPATWNSGLAWRTLWITTYTMVLSFATWYVVSAIAPRLNDVGFNLTPGELYWITAIPGVAAGVLRFIFMFLPPILGTRWLVALSAGLLLLPLAGWTAVVRDASTPFWVLLVLSFASGVGGGSFSGLMPSTSYFFPKRMSGTALGLQAGIGNFGIGLVQLLVPWLVGFGLFGTAAITPQSTHDGQLLWLHNGGLFMVPWVILAVILAFTMLRRVPVSANIREQLDIFRLKHTWVMSQLYICGFGIFSGLAAQMGLMIKNLYGGFDDPPNPLAWAWIGPLLGAGLRALMGPLCDRYGGGRFTLIGAAGMFVGVVVTMFFLQPTDVSQFWGFLAGMLVIFVFSGFINAGTFKQMPMIFEKRQAGGAIGFTGAIAAFGPFFVGIALALFGAMPFFIYSAVWSAISVWLAWWYYVRPGAEKPS